jgi:hypothetical protein
MLKDGTLIYYQFNCDSVWLTMQNKDIKTVIFSMEAVLAPLTFRVGYQFIREFKNTILFSYGCAPNGPCQHSLIDKRNGKELKQLQELIYNAADQRGDFIVYFTKGKDSLTVDFIDRKLQYQVPVKKEIFVYIVPEQQFQNQRWENGYLILPYYYARPEDGNGAAGEVVVDPLKFK